jgi:hypothetical protein
VDRGGDDLFLVELREHREPEVLLMPQHSERTQPCGLGAQKEGRGGHHVLAGDGEVQGQVVTHEAPAPVPVGLRLVEEREEVAVRVAEVSGDVPEDRCVELAQDVLQGHYLDDLGVALDGQALRDQLAVEVVVERHRGKGHEGGVEVSGHRAVRGRVVDERPAHTRVREQVVVPGAHSCTSAWR